MAAGMPQSLLIGIGIGLVRVGWIGIGNLVAQVGMIGQQALVGQQALIGQQAPIGQQASTRTHMATAVTAPPL